MRHAEIVSSGADTQRKWRGPKPPWGTCAALPGGSTWLVARPHTSVASLFAARFRVWVQP